ncbi:MAG: NPCBM/NEW2 domain-containing protein [Planctomycetaceae bacterium]
MGAGQLLLVAAMVAAPDVEVTTLEGRPSLVASPATAEREIPVYRLQGARHTGQLVSITADAVELRQDGKSTAIPTADIMELLFVGGKSSQSPTAGRTRVELTDRSVLYAENVKVEGVRATITSATIGEMRVQRSEMRSILFRDPGGLRVEWNRLKARTAKSDLLVIQKETKITKGEKTELVKSLDFLQGAVSSVGAKSIAFQLDGNEIPVKRERVFGIVYANPRQKSGRDYVVYTTTGDVIRSRGLSFTQDRVQIDTVAGGTIQPELSKLLRVDFGGTRVQYLSDLEPRDVKYTPFFDHVYKYRRDRNEDGQLLRMDGKMFARGLYIHSKARLVYRLAGGFRRFQACMGIDQLVGRLGDVHVVISADGKVLVEADVRGVDKPRILDLDVRDVRDLEILVDFGRDLDISDHLDLGDAKLLR